MRKAPLFIVAAMIFALALLSPAYALVDKSGEFYVADYSGVLKDATKQRIIEANEAIESNSGGQIVVVTVEYLDGLYADEYAVRLMNDWGVGDADKNNGMLLLLATEENKAWLTQGAGIDTVFDSDKINSYLDKYFWDDFDNGEFDKAVGGLFARLAGWYEDFYDFDIDAAGPAGEGSAPGDSSIPPASPLAKALTPIVLVLIVWFIAVKIKRARKNREYRRQHPPEPPPPGESADQNVTYNVHNYNYGTRGGFAPRKREKPPKRGSGFFGEPSTDRPKERSGVGLFGASNSSVKPASPPKTRSGGFGGGHSSSSGGGRGGSSGGRSGGGGHSGGGGGGRR